EAERLALGRQFMSAENQNLLREQAAKSCAEEYPEDFVYDFIEPRPGDNFEFGINYKACGFCKFAARHGDQEILPHICGLDFEAYAKSGFRGRRSRSDGRDISGGILAHAPSTLFKASHDFEQATKIRRSPAVNEPVSRRHNSPIRLALRGRPALLDLSRP